MKVVNTTGLVTKKGSMTRLADESIHVETNLDVEQNRILIQIIDAPQYGLITVAIYFFLLNCRNPYVCLFSVYIYLNFLGKRIRIGCLGIILFAQI